MTGTVQAHPGHFRLGNQTNPRAGFSCDIAVRQPPCKQRSMLEKAPAVEPFFFDLQWAANRVQGDASLFNSLVSGFLRNRSRTTASQFTRLAAFTQTLQPPQKCLCLNGKVNFKGSALPLLGLELNPGIKHSAKLLDDRQPEALARDIFRLRPAEIRRIFGRCPTGAIPTPVSATRKNQSPSSCPTHRQLDFTRFGVLCCVRQEVLAPPALP